MADLKIKLSFNDESQASFTYDKLNGLKSFSLLTQAKTNTETLDYSVKSNAGSLTAEDIVPPEGDFYIDNFMKNITNEDLSLSGYDIRDGVSSSFTKYVCTSNQSITGKIYSTTDFKTFNVVLSDSASTQFDRIIFWGENLVVSGSVLINGVLRYAIGIYNTFGNTVKYVIVNDKTSYGMSSSSRLTRCLKVVNDKLFISIGGTTESGQTAYVLDSPASTNFVELPFNFNSGAYRQSEFVYDVIYNEGKYIFLTKYGIYSSKDLQTFTHELAFDYEGDAGSIVYHNGYYYITAGSNKRGLYVGQSLSSLNVKYADKIGGLINIYYYQKIFLLCSQSGTIWYTSDLKHFYRASFSGSELSSNATFGNIVLPPTDVMYGRFYILWQNEFYKYSTSPIIEQTLIKISSMYDYLMSKPQYDRIRVLITLDGSVKGNFINNGSIKYDNNSKTISLDYQHEIVVLQNKNYLSYHFDNQSLYGVFAILMLTSNPILEDGITLEEMSEEDLLYLENVKIKDFYLQETSLWEQLNKLCVAGQLVIYPQNDKIIVKRWV